MKKLIYPFSLLAIAFTLVLLTTQTACSKKDDAANFDSTNNTNNSTIELIKKYEIKSGIISYKEINSLMDVVPTYKVYFDEYGAKEAKYEYSSTGELETVTMQKADGWYYKVSLKYKSGEKHKEMYASGTESTFGFSSWGDKQKNEYKLKALSDTTIAQKTCKYYSYLVTSNPVATAGYKGIVLFYKVTNSSMLGTGFEAGYDATNIEENVAIPSTIWDLPAGITIATN